MRPPASIVRQLLLDLSLGSSAGAWPIYVSFLPDTPHNAACVYDTSARKDGRLMATGEVIEHPGIMIHVRGLVYPVVYSKADVLVKALDAVRKVSVVFSEEEVYVVHNISRSGGLLPLGVDTVGSSRRHTFSMNMTLTLSQVETGDLLTVDSPGWTVDDPNVTVDDTIFTP